jgi:hypothetical protein
LNSSTLLGKNLKERVLNGSLENDYDTLMQEA